MEKLKLINRTVEDYFSKNKSVSLVPAKDLMPQFISAGVFISDKNGLPIRKVLRDLDKKNSLYLVPQVFADRKTANVNWYFQRSKTSITLPEIKIEHAVIPVPKAKIVKDKDETYVLNICDEVLKTKGFRQHRFAFLLGDAGTKLPVDIYYPDLKLVIEYREYQHTNAVPFFDKPDKLTKSGVSRGEQRKIYDQRRRDILPQHGLTLIEINYTDFQVDSRNRIVRDLNEDLEIVKTILIGFTKN